MATLFDIDKAIREFDFEYDEETGEVLNEYALDDLIMERERKIENIACYVKELRASAKAIKEERDHMQERADRLNRKADGLQDYLVYALHGDKFSTPRCDVTYRKSEAVDIINDALIPDKFCKIETKRTPNKAEIKKAIKSGSDIDGAILVTRQNIQIR